MNNIIIKYVTPEAIIFELEKSHNIYLLCEVNGVFKIYDDKLNKIITPNANEWVKSHSNSSLESLLNLAGAFQDGMQCSYNGGDILEYLVLFSILIKNSIFHSELASKYASVYFIEICDPGDVPDVIDGIRNNWDELLDRFGEKELLNNLHRWVRFCNYNCPDNAIIFEKFIDRLDESVLPPSYPNTAEYDEKLASDVLKSVDKDLKEHKNVPSEILELAYEFKAKRLQRTV